MPTSAAAATTITSSTTFDGFGRPYKTSNPYRTETPEWTTNAYDSLGRILNVKAPDGSAVVTNSYVGRTTTTTDASGTPAPGASQGKTIRLVDAFGRLKEVTEDP